jgi:hypothetical protein
LYKALKLLSADHYTERELVQTIAAILECPTLNLFDRTIENVLPSRFD